jgi:hypothetical protein
MISPVNGSRAPLACRWILFRKRSDFLRVSNWTRALCIRRPEVPRIVTEKDCRGCKFWESASTRELT